MSGFDAVIFDWMLTLAHYPSPAEHVAAALRSSRRAEDAETVGAIVGAMASARELPEVQAAEAVEDTSREAHHFSEYLVYERAGIDPDLAAHMYALLGDPDFHQPYPDARPVLHALREAGLRIGVVSDIHVDLRAHAELFGFGSCIEAWALSFELGIQKPDPRIFRSALEQLGCDAERTLMVGDRPSRDGAAADLGMRCLILPAPSTVTTRGLESVLHLVAPGRTHLIG